MFLLSGIYQVNLEVFEETVLLLLLLPPGFFIKSALEFQGESSESLNDVALQRNTEPALRKVAAPPSPGPPTLKLQ